MLGKEEKESNLSSPRGTYDILPEDEFYWKRIRDVIERLSLEYGFGRIETPIFENIDLFLRGTGETTDIVEKQMYELVMKGKDKFVLRPEGTPGAVRVYIEYGMVNRPQPVKLYYFGPMFRYEAPQAGRFRQFYQFGAESIGGGEPVLDAQIIQLSFNVLKTLGLKDLVIEVNSIGDKECLPKYRAILKDYYRANRRRLCRNCRRRFKKNVLRILDCKEESCQQISHNAPQVIDYLCQKCHNHFRILLEFLDELDLPYILNSRLVRGLDYYTRTVFEIFPEEIRGRQSALAGGGRYDYLVEALGGRPTPAVGVSMGIERIINLIKERDVKITNSREKKGVFLVQIGELGKKRSLKFFEELWRAKIPVAESFSRDTIKSQLKIADKLGLPVALILGQKEALDNNIIIRDMASGAQEIVSMAKAIREIKKRLRKCRMEN